MSKIPLVPPMVTLDKNMMIYDNTYVNGIKDIKPEKDVYKIFKDLNEGKSKAEKFYYIELGGFSHPFNKDGYLIYNGITTDIPMTLFKDKSIKSVLVV